MLGSHKPQTNILSVKNRQHNRTRLVLPHDELPAEEPRCEQPVEAPDNKTLPASPKLIHSKPLHVVGFTSLLSRYRRRPAVKCDCGRQLESPGLRFEGIKHLLMIVLFLGSLRLLWIDSQIKGIRYAFRKAGFQSKDMKYCILLLAMNLVYLPIALIVERIAATSCNPNKQESKLSQCRCKMVTAVHILNASTCLIGSSLFCYQFIWNPLIGTICESNTIITFFKLTSYCLTNTALRENHHLGTSGPEYYGSVRYPNNLTARNAVYFWFAPTLIYQPVYPRTERIRWQVFWSLVGETLVGLIFIWMLSLKLAAPILNDTMIHYETGSLQLVDDFIKLCAVNITIWLLGFFVIFQSVLNLLAEITRFADRDFYRDWWNAGCLGTYWRDWNKPISNFLRRHVYYPLRSRKVGNLAASIIVFFISAVFHELLVGVATKNFNGVAFFSMMAQVPLIKLTEPLEKIRGPGTTIGNCIFWLSILLGQPTGLIIYYVSWSLKHK
ncbi:Diacylglycerol O-acyltransferase 1 [Wickerhamiella sorbophila]|uniref:O-acyltransferase n=1 Tax=Wickerhamiella sorbophila TaxID=45607 RepID=A0A2T0FFJ2_9ASCO|nr:Diacylglycerol O-acyltransferase 1 [Wickerhamiella sorbophila]PRT53744.1 Diacylglycerol O-acyltransferase 1 [Wickerhamiella sorbophila]